MKKQFISVVMAFAMCLSLITPAFAEVADETHVLGQNSQILSTTSLIDFGASGFTLDISSLMATNDTCPLYGTHQYMPRGLPASNHPHEVQVKCECGSTRTGLGLKYFCSSCTANSKEVGNSELTKGVLSFIDGDQGLGAAILVPVDLYVKYTNTYNNPAQNNPMYPYSGLPPFASSFSKVYYSVENVVGFAPPVIVVASRSVEYYKSSGSILSTQTMSWNRQNEAIPTAAQYYTLSEKPAYTICSAMCRLSDSPGFFNGTVTTSF